jgi:hypothetical protein
MYYPYYPYPYPYPRIPYQQMGPVADPGPEMRLGPIWDPAPPYELPEYTVPRSRYSLPTEAIHKMGPVADPGPEYFGFLDKAQLAEIKIRELDTIIQVLEGRIETFKVARDTIKKEYAGKQRTEKG